MCRLSNFPTNCAVKKIWYKIQDFCVAISNQMHLTDVLDSSVFYLVGGVEVVTIKSLEKVTLAKLCCLFRFLNLRLNFGTF